MKQWLEMEYDAGTLRHRELVAEKVEKYTPESVLDVGCASGPDMALLKLRNPDLRIGGFDLAPENVKQATEHGLLVQEADVYTKLPEIPSKSFDVVLSNGVMMYVENRCLDELVRIARRAVILSERDPAQRILDYIREELHIEPIITKVTEEVRDSWKRDGFIYELCLNSPSHFPLPRTV